MKTILAIVLGMMLAGVAQGQVLFPQYDPPVVCLALDASLTNEIANLGQKMIRFSKEMVNTNMSNADALALWELSAVRRASDPTKIVMEWVQRISACSVQTRADYMQNSFLTNAIAFCESSPKAEYKRTRLSGVPAWRQAIGTVVVGAPTATRLEGTPPLTPTSDFVNVVVDGAYTNRPIGAALRAWSEFAFQRDDVAFMGWNTNGFCRSSDTNKPVAFFSKMLPQIAPTMDPAAMTDARLHAMALSVFGSPTNRWAAKYCKKGEREAWLQKIGVARKPQPETL